MKSLRHWYGQFINYHHDDSAILIEFHVTETLFDTLLEQNKLESAGGYTCNVLRVASFDLMLDGT